MASTLESALAKLTEIQRQAVEWNQGPLLVLAGPGSGKTQVLTCRISRLLDTSKGHNFRVLALTFTNKAADEMKGRVAAFVPGFEDRANIVGTFHSFCGQILRQHGVHLGINPDFAIYSADDDRKAVLEDALRRGQAEGKNVSSNDVKYLGLIDRMKSRLVEPASAEAALARLEDRKRAATTYQLYEEELRRINALDFNSLILEAYRLVKTYPAIGARYRRSYPHWLIDEFQDTNRAQYKLLRALAGSEFRNLFAVADDDQIIYEWNGASYKQIQSFLTDSAELIQLPTNYRCPAAIVEAANRLVVYNAQRTSTKKPLIAGKTEVKYPTEEHIQLRVFGTEEEEAVGIAQEIAERGRSIWGQTTVLARTRALLERMHKALQKREVPSVIAQRRDDFLSAEFRWLVAALRQIARPLDRRNVAALVEAFNRLAETALSVEQVITEAEATGRGYLATWLETARAQQGLADVEEHLLTLLSPCTGDPSAVKAAIEAILDLEEFGKKLIDPDADSDLGEDMAAWKELSRDIAGHIGKNAPLDQFLQELQLRSKEPTPKPDTVTLMTIHGAKGREFDCVYVIGLAEDGKNFFQRKLCNSKRGEGRKEN